MDNLEKAKKASLIAADIEKCKIDVSNIKSAIRDFENKYRYSSIKLINGNFITELPVNKDIYDLLLLQAEGMLREKELELDKLLNGEINKIKSIIEERECE